VPKGIVWGSLGTDDVIFSMFIDILPDRTLPTLMKEFDGKLPHPLPAGKRLLPLWCFKYTVLIRDRGVLADKG
jgi:hypothetical protein